MDGKRYDKFIKERRKLRLERRSVNWERINADDSDDNESAYAFFILHLKYSI